MMLCKDCRWAKPPQPLLPFNRGDFLCMNVRAVEPRRWTDYVLGEPVPARRLRCLEARNDPDYCGPEGHWWEPIGFGNPSELTPLGEN